MVGILGSLRPVGVVLVVVEDRDDSAVVSRDELSDFVGVPVDGIA